MFEVVMEINNEYKVLFNGKFSECQDYVKANNLILNDNLFIR